MASWSASLESCNTFTKAVPIDVVVTCHDRYLDWLPGCLESIDTQGIVGGRVVVFDGCEPPAWLAQRKPHWKVLRGDWRNPNPARNAGMEVTASPWIVWFDADNLMPAGYLAACQEQAAQVHYKVGLIYPDIQYCNEAMQPSRLLKTGEYDYWRLRRNNFVDTSSCWRRSALRAVGGWATTSGLDDWALAIALTREGWSGAHLQGPAVLMREHSRYRRSMVQAKSKEECLAALWPHRTVAIMTLLASGREAAHQRWLQWLRVAELPPHAELLIVDNRIVGDKRLLREAEDCRQWMATTVIRDDGRPAGSERAEPLTYRTDWHAIHDHVARLYRRAFAATDADLILTLEDDVEPPPNAVPLLHEAFTSPSSVGACGGLYASPSHQGEHACAALAPDRWGLIPLIQDWPARQEPVMFLGGGCTLYAGWALREALPVEVLRRPRPSGGDLGWDATLSLRLREAGYMILMDGRVRCQHHLHGVLAEAGIPNTPSPASQQVPPAWLHWNNVKQIPEGEPLERYRRNFITGQAASALLAGTMRRASPELIVSLGDSEAAVWGYERLATVEGLGPRWLSGKTASCGFNDEDREVLREAFDAAIELCPYYVCQYNWPQAEHLQMEAFASRGLDPVNPGKPKVDCDAIYRMHEYGDLFPMLAGYRVLMIGGHEQVGQVLMDGGFRQAHADLGALCDYQVVGHVQVPARHQVPKHTHIKRLEDEIAGKEFDLALLSAGALSFVLGEFIVRVLHRRAFDIGAVDRMVLGEKRQWGQRFRVAERRIPLNGNGWGRS